MSGHPPKQKLSREEIAHLEVGRTDISPALARFMMFFFLAVMTGVPLAQHAWELVQHRRGERESALPQCWDIWRSPAAAWKAGREAEGDLLARLVAGNRVMLEEIKRYEDDLEDGAWLAKIAMPVAQTLLTRVFGVGNEKTYLGRDGWLFYRPEIEHLTGRGFLDPLQLKHRAGSGDSLSTAPQPDPVVAIAEFHDQLAARGVELIVMPAPVKGTVHPERFASRFEGSTNVVRNRSDAEFVERLRAKGVEVFDAATVLADFRRGTGGPAYLATDTHWRPEAMDAVARALAAVIERRIGPPAAPVAYTGGTASVTNRGDLAAMLTLIDESWPAPEVAELQPVRAPDGRPWATDRAAEVMLLGDSFCNIFSLESMGWGAASGFAEHLSLHLKRPVDRIARNDAGAYATRQMLIWDLARKPERLKGKKIVVWEFSARELSIGDWKRMDMR